MHSDFITVGLPESVLIDGKKYPINCDFRIGMQFERILKGDGSDDAKLLKLLSMYYPKIPPNLNAAIDRMLWFYRCGEEEEKEEKPRQRYQRRTSKEPAYSFAQDAPYIYAAFKEQYGIDLTESDMHWWKFVALFESLSEDTKMSKIMYYRKASTSGMPKERRAFINEMKKLYQIKASSKKKMTLEERNQKWREYVKARQYETNMQTSG